MERGLVTSLLHMNSHLQMEVFFYISKGKKYKDWLFTMEILPLTTKNKYDG